MRLTIVLGCLLVPAAAQADSKYFGWGMSPGHQIDGELAQSLATDDEVGGRLMLGMRRADTAFEASFFGTDLHPRGYDFGDSYDSSTLSVGFGVKQFVALHPNVELFVRGGLDRTWLERYGENNDDNGLEGWGLDYGAGVEAGSRPGGFGGRVWLDLGRQHARLRAGDGAEAIGVTFTSVSAGVTLLWGR